MTIVTYSNASLGFGVTYDDAETARAEGTSDPRYAAAWTDRFTTRVAGGAPGPRRRRRRSPGGSTPSLLVTTDRSPLSPGTLSRWDWDEVTGREAAPFMTLTGADEIDSAAIYWRGFPVLQLAVVDPPDDRPGMPVQMLGMLYTPA